LEDGHEHGRERRSEDRAAGPDLRRDERGEGGGPGRDHEHARRDVARRAGSLAVLTLTHRPGGALARSACLSLGFGLVLASTPEEGNDPEYSGGQERTEDEALPDVDPSERQGDQLEHTEPQGETADDKTDHDEDAAGPQQDARPRRGSDQAHHAQQEEL